MKSPKCPKCQGRLTLDELIDERFVVCQNCGWRKDITEGFAMAKRGTCSVCGRKDMSCSQTAGVLKCGACYKWHREGHEGLPPSLMADVSFPVNPAAVNDEPVVVTYIPTPVDDEPISSIYELLPIVETPERVLELPDCVWQELDRRGIDNLALQELIRLLLTGQLVRRAA